MGRFIPDDVIEQIRGRADIVDVVQSYLPGLKKFGSTWKACCPFHQEKTPSFIVNPSRQTYHCFGCQKGGNVFSFVMELERLDFPNAVELLARKYQVVIPEPAPYYGNKGKDSTHSKSDYNTRERLFELHEKIASWYANNLHQFSDSAVAAYWKTRQIPLEYRNRFQIGAAPDSWDGALTWAKRAGFSEEEIKLSGIATEQEEKKGHLYDRFRNRLMFPIWNEQGRVVAFSARTIEKNPKAAKYVNSPESIIFKKSRILYALHFARTAIHDKGYAVLCEGQLDTIAMHRAGCTNAVAPQGVAFGEEQAAILRRYTNRIHLAMDNDKAGCAAVFKDATILLPMGLSLKVVRYSDAKDADEVLAKQGPEALADSVENAIDFFEFAFQQESADRSLDDPGDCSAIAKRMLELIQLLDSVVTQDLYLTWLAEKLSIHSEALRQQLSLLKKKQGQDADRQAFFASRREASALSREKESNEQQTVFVPRSQKNLRLRKAMEDLFSLVIERQEYADRAEVELLPEMLDDSPLAQAIEISMQSKYHGEFNQLPSLILEHFLKQSVPCPPDISMKLTASSDRGETEKEEPLDESPESETPPSVQAEDEDSPHVDARNREKEFLDCIKWIKYCFYQDECERITKLCEKLPPGEQLNELTRQFLDYSKKKMALSKLRYH